MAVIGADSSINDSRYIYAGLPPVVATSSDESTLNEVWLADADVTQHDATVQHNITLHSASTTDVMLIMLQVPKPELTQLADISRTCYAKLFAHAQQHGFEYILRIWNYLADINAHPGDQERYKQFCLGRYEAYLEQHTKLNQAADFEPELPAASALGLADGGLLIYALAAKQFGQPIENPRQVSAYHYPRQYGPKSPSFARALLQGWPEHEPKHLQLYISGTASVVGHASEHTGNVTAQTYETLKNIQTLMDETVKTTLSHQAQQAFSATDWRQPETLKVYLRNPNDHAAVDAILQAELQCHYPIMYLQGDICRAELLLEIEAIYSSPCNAK